MKYPRTINLDPDGTNFLNALLSNPFDDLARKAFADYLEEKDLLSSERAGALRQKFDTAWTPCEIEVTVVNLYIDEGRKIVLKPTVVGLEGSPKCEFCGVRQRIGYHIDPAGEVIYKSPGLRVWQCWECSEEREDVWEELTDA